jgi:hypothetical protein
MIKGDFPIHYVNIFDFQKYLIDMVIGMIKHDFSFFPI